jgi:hypothetical protein
MLRDKQWTSFGLGFMYTTVGEWRYHFWHPYFTTVGLSDTHTHPWNFISEVIGGSVTNVLYEEVTGATHHKREILCDDAYCEAFTSEVSLKETSRDIYTSGQSYALDKDQIHCAIVEPYSMTRIKRSDRKDECAATIYWPVGTKFQPADKDVILSQHVVDRYLQNRL